MTPINVNGSGSTSLAQQINNTNKHHTKSEHEGENSAQTISISQLSAPIEVIVEPPKFEPIDLVERLEQQNSAVKTMFSETKQLMAEIAEEKPEFKERKFDFTNTGEEIEVIHHNLSEREYNYLKNKLNSNKKLVKATEFLNQSVLDWKRGSTGNNYQLGDIAGRIHVMDVMKEAKEQTEWRIEYNNNPNREPFKPGDKRTRYSQDVYRNAVNIMEEMHISVRNRA